MLSTLHHNFFIISYTTTQLPRGAQRNSKCERVGGKKNDQRESPKIWRLISSNDPRSQGISQSIDRSQIPDRSSEIRNETGIWDLGSEIWDRSQIHPRFYSKRDLHVLSNEPDFKSQKSWLSETAEKYPGCRLIFYPKFHSELNFIEMVWAWAKAHHRSTCTYKYNDLKTGLPVTFDELMPISFVR